MTYSKGQQISPKTSHIWYNQEQYHPPFGFIDTASGSSNTKKGNVPKDILAILIKPPKLSLTFSLGYYGIWKRYFTFHQEI